jgi:hypothetical protein
MISSLGVRAKGVRFIVSGLRIQGFRFRVLGSRVQNLEFGGRGLGFRIYGLGLLVRVKSSWCRVNGEG